MHTDQLGFPVSISLVRQCTLEWAREVLEQNRDKRPCGLLAAKGKEQLIIELDGSMIGIVSCEGPHRDRRKNRMREWREVKLGVVWARGEVCRRFEATLGGPEEIERLLAWAAEQAGEGLETKIHCVADGSVWIWNLFERRWKTSCAGRYTGVLDLMHVNSYLSGACAGDQAQSRRLSASLREGNTEEVMEALRAMKEPEGKADGEAPVGTALQYLENRRGELDYPTADRLKLPVGSGVVESAHRQVLQGRLKVAGAAWEKGNAAAMAALCAQRSTQELKGSKPKREAKKREVEDSGGQLIAA